MEAYIDNSRPDPTIIDIGQVAEVFSDLLKTPNLTSAVVIQDEDQDVFINITTQWSSADVVSNDKASFVRTFSILKSSLGGYGSIPTITSSPPIPCPNNTITEYSRNGTQKAVVFTGAAIANAKSGKEPKGEDGQFLKIYGQESLIKCYDLKKLDKHGSIYSPSEPWGSTIQFSPDERKLAYLAEKKIPKAVSLLSKVSENEKDARKGEEFEFRQSWGEQLNSCFQSVIVVLNLDTDEFQVLELPDKLFPSDLQWVDNASIVGTGYISPEWRLGLIYCTNRESRIFQVGIDGQNFRYISQANRAASCPRVNPDSTFLIWQERDPSGPHLKSMEILGSKLQAELESPILLYPIGTTEYPVYESFPQKCCWSPDGRKIYTVTCNDILSVLLEFSFTTDPHTNKPILTGIDSSSVLSDIDAIYEIHPKFILASRSSTLDPPHLILITLPDHKIFELTKPKRIVTQPVYRLRIPGIASPDSFYYGPAGDTIKRGSVPLIVNPHGGPHSNFSEVFTPEIALFLNLGYGYLRINYIGSTGGTSDVTDRLPGHIGIADVKDCQRTVQSLLSQDPTLDPEKIVVFGGSHGGFLGAHLSSQFPDFYKAACLRNPVVDLAAMFSVTDITDWNYVELGINDQSKVFAPLISNIEDAKKAMAASPIQNAAKVKGATLLLLGSEDLRVPMSQGLCYYRALLAAGKTANVRVYNDCHALQKVPVRFDSILQVVLWFAKYLKRS